MADLGGIKDDGPCGTEDVGEMEDEGDEVRKGSVLDDYRDVLCFSCFREEMLGRRVLERIPK